MGVHDGAVVDARLKVRGVSSLRVVDASIMPRIISGNTNAATIMVGEKASELVLATGKTVVTDDDGNLKQGNSKCS